LWSANQRNLGRPARQASPGVPTTTDSAVCKGRADNLVVRDRRYAKKKIGRVMMLHEYGSDEPFRL